MSKFYQQRINITSLRVNPDNVRYKESAEDQTAAMRMIIVEQGKKFINLARHISNNGLEPGRSIYVHPIANTNDFVVLDGNRRMSAVKVLLSNELQEEFKDILPKTFKKIAEHFNKNNKIEFVECTVFPKEEEAQQWIAVNHGFGAEGITTQNWDSDTRDKVMASFGTKKRERDGQILDYLRDSPFVNEALKIRLKKGKTNNTTLRRILSDDVLSKIGIRFQEGVLTFTASEKEVSKTLVRMVTDLVDKKVKVEKVWDEEKRKKYLDELQLDGDMPDLTVPLVSNTASDNGVSTDAQASANGQPSETSNQNTQNVAVRRPKAIKNSREYVLSKSFKLKDRDSRIVDIYNELTRIKVTENANAVSLLLRAFVEMLVKKYAHKHTIPGTGKEKPLREVVEKVVTHYLNQKRASGQPVDEGDFRGILEACDKANLNSMFAIESFQQLVHREKLKPIPSEVIDRWANIEHAIVLLLDNM